MPPGKPARNTPRMMPTWLLAGPGKELAKRNNVREDRLIEPLAALDKFVREIADMSDWPAETTHSELAKDE